LETAFVDATLAILSAHHWNDLEQGFREMARVARKRVVLLTFVPDTPFWLTNDYFPEIEALDRKIFPREPDLAALLERTIGPARIDPLPIPHDCIDGFQGAYWRRPETYLHADARGAISSFPRINPDSGLAKLDADLADGRWAKRNGHLLALDELDLAYRIVRCDFAH